ncbi:MAG: single-stranded nucleic acid binding domain protein [Desulfomicrobiaceae bacterium]|jgi:spoIIIJ-associated protein|nr:single-stranded nucleic acid binding domain protein [Desulfomicrobiaceae bacterium]
MHPFREFRGKNVDEAILLACQALGVEREDLEIDIVSMGSSGIFGLGAKKAVVLARRRPPAVLESLHADEEATPSLQDPKHPEDSEDALEEAPADESEDDEGDETAPQGRAHSPEEMERLTAEVTRLLAPLLTPICGTAPAITVRQDDDGIIARIDDEAHNGLIIGREGQTILALQYILNRMLTKAWRDAPRVQLDAGDFRARQIQRLRSLAQNLAARAKRSGRIQSTGPLSSFHRRMVHLALRDDTEVRTVSKGSGPLKRVLVCPNRRRTP